jgi:hypothetical protein
MIWQRNFLSTYYQGHLNNIIGLRAKQCYTTTQRNKNGKLSIKLNIYYFELVQYFQQNMCLKIKKHAVHNIHKLAWAPKLVGTPGNFPVCPYVKTALHIIK